MAEIKDLSTTDASNNGTAANAGFPENMAYSDVNNAARALEGMIARWYADTNSTLDTGGSSNAYTLTPNRTVAAYARGDTYTVEASFTNTGAATINVSSLGAKSIVKPSGSAVASGDIQSGGIYTLVYDGTSFQMAGVDDPTTLSITTLTVSGVTTLNGNTVIGSDDSDTVTINADVASNVIPSADNTYDLGASGSEWKDLYIDGIAYVDTLNADSVDIDGGSIDGTTIGGSSAAAGTFTTISGTTITASTSLKTPLIEYTDGDDAITIADGGGVTIADLTATTADINGGTFDGIVGGTTPAAGSFTTITASGDITAIGLKAIESVNGDPVLGHFYNENSGAAAESTVYITNSSTVADGLFLQAYGASATTAGGFVQDGATIGSGTGASGGLSIMTRAAADMRFYTNGHTNLAMTIDSSQKAGIGTSSPASRLHLMDDFSTDVTTYAELVSGTTFTINGNDTEGSDVMRMGAMANGTGDYFIDVSNWSGAGDYNLIVNPFGGKLAIGTTDASGNGTLIINTADSNHIRMTNGGELGQIYVETDGDMVLFAHGDESIIFMNGTGTGTERTRINSTGQLLQGTSSGNYTHDHGMRIYSGEVGSNVLDAALSLQGTGGDFYAQNWIGQTNVGFGLLAVFSGTTDYLTYRYMASGTVYYSRFDITQNGDLTCAGTLTEDASDERLKDNISLIGSPIQKIKSIRGVEFDWKEKSPDEMGLELPHASQHDVGVIAQEVESILPEAVSLAPFDSDAGTSVTGENYLTVNYKKLIPILIEGIKEQQTQIEALQSEVAALKGG